MSEARVPKDFMWALMMFLLFSVLSPGLQTWRRAGLALVFSFAIEVSPLYHASWIDELRRTPLGGLVLGFGFLWSDILCYALGVVVGAAMESVLIQSSGGRYENPRSV